MPAVSCTVSSLRLRARSAPSAATTARPAPDAQQAQCERSKCGLMKVMGNVDGDQSLDWPAPPDGPDDDRRHRRAGLNAPPDRGGRRPDRAGPLHALGDRRVGRARWASRRCSCRACTARPAPASSSRRWRGVDGVHSVQVSAAAQRATVCWDPERTRPSHLIEAVRRAGYDAVPDAAAPARDLRRREHRQALWRLFVASFCAMQVMMMATPSLRGRPRRAGARPVAVAGLGQLAAVAAGAGVFGRPVLQRRLAQRCASAASPWTCRWRWAWPSPSSPAPAPPSTPAASSVTRSTSIR